MTGKRIKQEMNFLQLGPYRLELRLEEDGLVYLTAFSVGFPVNLSVVASSSRTGDMLVQALGDCPGPTLIPVSQLAAIRALLQTLTNESITIDISPEVAALHQVTLRDAPTVHYLWCTDEQLLRRDPEVVYCGQGWFMTGQSYWHWLTPSDVDDIWLNKQTLQSTELHCFLRDVLPNWQSMELPVTCDLRFSPEPVVSFTTQNVTAEKAELTVRWVEDPDNLSALTGLLGFVLVRDKLCPGIVLDELGGQLSADNCHLLLRGEEIPQLFTRLSPSMEQLLNDPTGALAKQHSLLKGTSRLLLQSERDERRGIGTIHAVPTFQLDAISVPAVVVSRQLETAKHFVRLPNGWVTIEQVQSTGIGRFGRAQNGFALDPITLTPMEVLWRGSPRLEGPWSGLECPEVVMPTDSSPKENAYQHLVFLTHLGLPGGLLGTVNQCALPLISFLENFQDQRQGQARILIVGTKTVLNFLCKLAKPGLLLRLDQQAAESIVDLRQTGIVLLTPATLEGMPGLEKIDWDIICVINVDSLLKSRNSRLYSGLRRLHKLLFLGLFTDLGFRQRNASREAISELMEVEDLGPQLLWRYLLRDPNEPVRELVPPYQPAQSRATGQGMVEYVVRHRESPGVPYYLAYEAHKFVDAAKYLSEQLGKRPVKPAHFVEYYQFRPNYDSMNARQFGWYVFWRDQVCLGQYPDTGLDYITLFAYELINQVNIDDPRTGYELLHCLWLNYRARFPNLDNTLLNWLVDYLLVNPLPIDPLQPYREAVALDVTLPYTNILLKEYLGRPWEQLPHYFVERLSTYPSSRSRFYLADNADLVQRAAGRALAVTDEYYHATFGQGIWQFYRPRRYQVQKRLPFQNALFAGQSKLINFGSALPYCEQAALRSLVTAVVKHAENALREQHGYRGRLRSYHLPPELAQMINANLSGLDPSRTATRYRIPISIDLSKVKSLTLQSNEVRDLLISQHNWLVDGRNRVDMIQSTKDDDLEPLLQVNDGNLSHDGKWSKRLVARLSPLELQLLSALGQADNGLSHPELLALCSGHLVEPLLDRINELALDTCGDLLISERNGVRMIEREYQQELLQSLSIQGQHCRQQAVLTGEWLALYANLGETELQALAILAQPEKTSEWQQFCLTTGELPQVLVDKCNGTALETIGDLVLDTALAEPTIMAEYLPLVLELLEYWRGDWHNGN